MSPLKPSQHGPVTQKETGRVPGMHLLFTIAGPVVVGRLYLPHALLLHSAAASPELGCRPFTNEDQKLDSELLPYSDFCQS